MRLRLLLASFIILSTIFFNTVLAQYTPVPVSWDQVRMWFSITLGIPEAWVEWPNAFWLIILPYFATLVIIFGLMEEIRIFRHAEHKTTIYFLISLGWAMFLIPTGILGMIATWLYTAGAFISVIAFSIVFIVGVFWWGRRGWALWKPGGIEDKIIQAKTEQLNRIDNQIQAMENQIINITSQLRPPTDAELDKIDKLNAQIDVLRRRRKKIQYSI